MEERKKSTFVPSPVVLWIVYGVCELCMSMFLL